MSKLNPDFYTMISGEAVAADESSVVAEREFRVEMAENYVAVSAMGDWHDEVPEGMVGIVATLGASRKPDAYEAAKRFLVSKADYDARGQHGYVVTDNDESWDCADTRQTKQVHSI